MNNLNKKITSTILMGLTALTFAGCSSKTTIPIREPEKLETRTAETKYWNAKTTEYDNGMYVIEVEGTSDAKIPGMFVRGVGYHNNENGKRTPFKITNKNWASPEFDTAGELEQMYFNIMEQQ